MSFLFSKSKAPRKPNMAETLLANTKRVAEVREHRLIEFVPILASHLVTLMTTASLSLMFGGCAIEFNLRWLLNEDILNPNRIDRALVQKFTGGLNVPVPNFAELRVLLPRVAAILADPVKYGFECVVDTDDTKLKVLWNNPIVPDTPDLDLIEPIQVAEEKKELVQ